MIYNLSVMNYMVFYLIWQVIPVRDHLVELLGILFKIHDFEVKLNLPIKNNCIVVANLESKHAGVKDKKIQKNQEFILTEQAVVKKLLTKLFHNIAYPYMKLVSLTFDKLLFVANGYSASNNTLHHHHI